MKYFSRSNEYRASNVVFRVGPLPMLQDCSAWSYNWWQFVKMVGGKMVFNSYNYSPSTCKHQSKVRQLIDGVLNAYPMRQKGISVEIPQGLQGLCWKEDGIKYAEKEIKRLEEKQKTGKPRSWAYDYRKGKINYFKNQIEFLKSVKED